MPRCYEAVAWPRTTQQREDAAIAAERASANDALQLRLVGRVRHARCAITVPASSSDCGTHAQPYVSTDSGYRCKLQDETIKVKCLRMHMRG